jgi:hypothetical protein
VNKTLFLKLAPQDRVAAIAGESPEPLVLQSTLAAAIGTCGARRLLAVATDHEVSSGAIGVKEVLDLREMIERARREKLALVLVIDSAGAKVSEGIAIQGALRRLFSNLLAARAAGLTTIAILGRHVFGGASMLAMVCDMRLYADNTRLAMTGPAVIQSRNGVAAETVAETIATANRLKHDTQGAPATAGPAATGTDVRATLLDALAKSPDDYETWRRERDADLRARLADEPGRAPSDVVQVVDSRTVKLRGARAARPRDVMELVDTLHTVSKDSDRIVLDCEWAGHSIVLADEDRLISQYLTYLCAVIHAIEARGTRVCLKILGELSGGLYIALAGAASEVRLAANARVLTLPQDILDAFVQMPPAPNPRADTLIAQGVIDTAES